MEELTRQRREGTEHERADSVEYSAAGHPLVEQLVAEQGTGPVTDASVFHGDFRPEEGPVEEVFERPRDPYTIRLMSDAPRLSAAATGSGQTPTAPAGRAEEG